MACSGSTSTCRALERRSSSTFKRAERHARQRPPPAATTRPTPQHVECAFDTLPQSSDEGKSMPEVTLVSSVDGPEGAPVLVLGNPIGTNRDVWSHQLPVL